MVTAPSPANASAPRFTPEAWNGPAIDLRGSNCFQYAFGGSDASGTNHLYDESVPNPGMTGGRVFPTIPRWFAETSNLLNVLQLDGIPILPPTGLPPAKPGHYLVGLYIDHKRDIHWVRQDADGGWSHKPGIGAQVARFLEPGADGGYRPLSEQPYQTGYRFVGYAYAPAQGVNLGIEPVIAEALRRDPLSNLDFVFVMTTEQIGRVQRTLARGYPDVAPRFAATYAEYIDLEAMSAAESLKADASGKTLASLFANPDTARINEIQAAIAANYPQALEAFTTARAVATEENFLRVGTLLAALHPAPQESHDFHHGVEPARPSGTRSGPAPR